MPLTVGQIARFQAVALRMLNDTCQIQSYTALSDNQGGQTDTWTTTQTDVPCTVAPSGLSPAERVIAQRLAAERVYSVTLPAATVITERDRLVWRGHTFEVKSVGLRTVEITRRVVAEEVV